MSDIDQAWEAYKNLCELDRAEFQARIAVQDPVVVADYELLNCPDTHWGAGTRLL